MPLSDVGADASAEKAISPSSRERILLAAKHLFARNGYENTSTVAIARDAGTSESQLMKHFGSKQGLLASILDRGWAAIIQRVQAIEGDARLADRLLAMLETIVIEMENDHELKELMTLEAHRVRKDSRDVLLSRGYRQFAELFDRPVKRDAKAGANPAGRESGSGARRLYRYGREFVARSSDRPPFRFACELQVRRCAAFVAGDGAGSVRQRRYPSQILQRVRPGSPFAGDERKTPSRT